MVNPLSLLLRGIREIGLRPSWDAIVHTVRARWVEAKFADPETPLQGFELLQAVVSRLSDAPLTVAPAGPVTATLGQLRSHTRRGQTLTLTFAHGTLTVTILAPAVIRLKYQGPNLDPNLLDPSEDAQSPAVFEVSETPQALQITTEQLRCTIARSDGQITLSDPAGNLVAEQAEPVGWTGSGRVVSRWILPSDIHLYGLGQRAAGLDRRGGAYLNWNTDPRTYKVGDDPLNLCIPFLLALHSGGQQGYGLLLGNITRSQLDLGKQDADILAITVEDNFLEMILFYGPALSDVLEQYTAQTGRTPLPALWTLGYHQSRWSYYPEKRVRRLAREFRQTYQVPCDGIHLDIHYMDGYRCFTWDTDRFPDSAGMIADLHQQGFKLVTIIDPGIKADRNYRVFQEGLEQDVFCRLPDGQLFTGPVWPGNCAFPDFTASHVRQWWGEQYRALVDVGVDGIWNDMNEPALFGENGATIPGPVRHDMDGQDKDHRHTHNLYGLLTARATAEGLERLTPDQRPFVLTRSGWTGIQKYAAHWTGDNRATWESLRLTLPMILNLGLSGVAFTGADVGGFNGFPSGELFTRWLQLGVFLPLLRAHTILSSPDQEPWSWGEPYLNINREIIRLRYRLLPYLYTAFWQCSQTGLPMVRPLFLDFQEDLETFERADQFLCGDALLVAPVLEEGSTRRSVYLPQGKWTNFWTNETHTGPTTIEVQAPLGRIPFFVRAGSVLPIGPVGDYVGQPSTEPLTLRIYPGQGESWLYEDDGQSMAHRRGEYRLSRFALSLSENQLLLRRETEGTFPPGYHRFSLVIHDMDRIPREVTGWTGTDPSYDPVTRTLQLDGESFEILTLNW